MFAHAHIHYVFHHSDADAFCSKDKLHHSLPKTGHRLWHDSLLHDSIGPLSSTRMDQSTRISVNKKPTDPLATKLFTLGGSGLCEHASINHALALKMIMTINYVHDA